nr:hypothetical protein [Tanacetum cinerariifolium]
IFKIKKKQAESQKNTQFIIKSTEKAALEEYDLKSALYQSVHANKSFNRNPTNHRLYHAIMEALIEYENAMNKGVIDAVKDHKIKHDDDDEDPLARPNQGKKTKRRRTKESESSKNSSTTKETSKGKASAKRSKTGKSASAKEPVEEPIAEVIMNDVGDDVARDHYPFDLSKPLPLQGPLSHRTVSADYFFNNDLEYLKTSNLEVTYTTSITDAVVVRDFYKKFYNSLGRVPNHPLARPNQGKKTKRRRTKESESSKNSSTTKETSKGKASTKRSKTGKSASAKEPVEEPIAKVIMDDVGDDVAHKIDWNNQEGDHYPFDLSKPLPLQGPQGHRTVSADYFFHNDLEYLKTSNPESVSVKKLHGYGHLEEIVVKRSDPQLYKFKEGDFVDLHLNDIEDMLLPAVQHKLFHLNGSDIVEFIMALRIVYEDQDKQKRVLRADELYKFSDSTLKSVRDEIHHIVLDFHLDYNLQMPNRKSTAVYRKRSGLMIVDR